MSGATSPTGPKPSPQQEIVPTAVLEKYKQSSIQDKMEAYRKRKAAEKSKEQAGQEIPDHKAAELETKKISKQEFKESVEETIRISEEIRQERLNKKEKDEQ